jgi:hypothetical protein
MASCLWYRAVLGDALVSACQIPMIREHFAMLSGPLAGPMAPACSSVRVTPRGKKMRQGTSDLAETVFFSPAAIAAVPHLIAVCGAEPSPPPDSACVTLLVGKESDWDLLPRRTH